VTSACRANPNPQRIADDRHPLWAVPDPQRPRDRAAPPVHAHDGSRELVAHPSAAPVGGDRRRSSVLTERNGPHDCPSAGVDRGHRAFERVRHPQGAAGERERARAATDHNGPHDAAGRRVDLEDPPRRLAARPDSAGTAGKRRRSLVELDGSRVVAAIRGDPPPQPQVLRAVDGAHAAAPDQRLQPVTTQLRPDRGTRSHGHSEVPSLGTEPTLDPSDARVYGLGHQQAPSGGVGPWPAPSAERPAWGLLAHRERNSDDRASAVIGRELTIIAAAASAAARRAPEGGEGGEQRGAGGERASCGTGAADGRGRALVQRTIDEVFPDPVSRPRPTTSCRSRDATASRSAARQQ
jgi:hypothetical protein